MLHASRGEVNIGGVEVDNTEQTLSIINDSINLNYSDVSTGTSQVNVINEYVDLTEVKYFLGARTRIGQNNSASNNSGNTVMLENTAGSNEDSVSDNRLSTGCSSNVNFLYPILSQMSLR